MEVVVVDDCSPDDSGRIAAEFARRDSRVRLSRTEANGGSGAARNQGLRQATGEYVWFVDADDRVAPGAVERIVERIGADRCPDLLLIQHSRISSDGVQRPAFLPRLAEESPVDTDFFALQQWTGIIPYTHTPWTKIARRELLADGGLEFPSGWYTDIPWTYGLLRRVNSIGLVLEESYLWHQRPQSSITLTQDRKHFDVFVQWERTWRDWDAVEDDGLRTALFEHMVWHLLIVMGNTDRIVPSHRREFFLAAHDICARYRPPSWKPKGLKQRLLLARSFRSYMFFRWVWRLVRLVRGRRRPRSEPPTPPQRRTSRSPASSIEA